MSVYSRKLKILDTNLISGSGDSLRDALGGSWQQVSSSERGLEYMIKPVQSGFADSSTDDPWALGNVRNFFPNEYLSFVLRNGHDYDILKDVSYTSKNVQPIIRFPIRLYGTNELIRNDEHWSAIVAGGLFNDKVYDGIYNDDEFADHWFNYSLPYETLQLRQLNLANETSFTSVDIGYKYNYYYRGYERYLSEVEHELLIPNAYIMQAISSVDDIYRQTFPPPMPTMAPGGPGSTPESPPPSHVQDISLEEFSYSQCDTDILNYINRQNYWPATYYTGMFRTAKDYYNLWAAKPIEFAYMAESPLLKMYYNTLGQTKLEDSTASMVKSKLKNVIFDHSALEKEFMELLDNKEALPMYTKIKLPPAGGGVISEAIRDNDASTKFLVTLKDVFVNKSTNLLNSNVQFAVQETQNTNPVKESNDFYNLNVNLVDMGELLFHMRENYLNTDDDFYCIGNMNVPSKKSVYDKEGFYRYINTLSMTETLTAYLDYVDDDQYLEKIKSPYFETATATKKVETMAYRIEKIGGLPTGDTETQEVLQNFYCMNVQDINRSELLDTQVRYGQQYTYNIYAYVLVSGYRYQTSDLRITRLLSELTPAAPDLEERGVESINPLYCLEFYDPVSGERKDKLVESMQGLYGAELAARALQNDFATDAQVASEWYKYLADMNLTIQPSVKLIEIPIASKTVTILDHPPNLANALPFATKDTNNTIGFEVEYRTFEKLPYPETLNDKEEEHKNRYLVSNSFTETTDLQYGSIAEPRHLEIYRLDQRPLSYKDFDGKRVHFFDLLNVEGMADVEFELLPSGAPLPPVIGTDGEIVLKDVSTFTEKVFTDRIKENKKYYYVMRFLNEREEPGHFSPIYCAELVNDGGYLYPLFDIIETMEEQKPEMVNTTTDFKKLFRLDPNIRQLLFDDSAVDYSKPAYTQKELMKVGVSEEPIWDKTFKIRLTSKKTGKKIDLNITYKLSRS